MVAKAERSGGCGGEAVVVVGTSRRRRTFNKPSWLLCNIADINMVRGHFPRTRRCFYGAPIVWNLTVVVGPTITVRLVTRM
ncbi:hypothetical protein OROGR_023246 [Orobanche gracilis]